MSTGNQQIQTGCPTKRKEKKMRILNTRCIFVNLMFFLVLLQLVLSYISSGNSSQVVFNHHGSSFIITVYSNGKVEYSNLRFHTSFDIRNCAKFFQCDKYDITSEDFATTDAVVILMLYGDILIENHRNKAAEKKSAFSLNETPCNMEDDIGTFEDIIPNANAVLPENAYIQSEFNELIRNAIRKLPEKQQEVINKMYFEGKSGIEIAEELGIDASSVSGRKKSALKNLQKMPELKRLWDSN